MLEQGLIARLVDLTKSDDRGLRLNALWAFKNLLHKSSSALKQTVMTALGWSTLSRYDGSPYPVSSEVDPLVACWLTQIRAYKSKHFISLGTSQNLKKMWTHSSTSWAPNLFLTSSPQL